MAINKKSKITDIISKVMKPIAETLVKDYAKKSELDNAIDEVKNSAIVKDVPVSVENDTLIFEDTADALIDGETLVIGEE